MKIHAIIPVKELSLGKTRLGAILPDGERQALNRRFLDHVLDLAGAMPGLERTIVVSADPRVIEIAEARGALGLREARDGLNDAVAQAADHARRQGDGAILVLPTDLPLARADDILAMTTTGADFAIAPDRRGDGTNALFIAPRRPFAFHFGPASFEAHLAEARRHGLDPFIVHRPGLAFDVDTPDDYAEWTETLEPAGQTRRSPPSRRSRRAL